MFTGDLRVPRTLLLLGISATIAVGGCSSSSKAPVQVAGGGLCESYVATAGQSAPGPERTDWFDKSIKTCRSLEQWESAVTAYAASAAGGSPTAYLAERCSDPGAGLGQYQLCGLLTISLATPRPEPTKKVKHKPKKTAKPKAKRTPAAAAARRTPSPAPAAPSAAPSPASSPVPSLPPGPSPVPPPVPTPTPRQTPI
jgi:hypothetical protein